MKGFLKVVEAIIASMILFLAFLYTSYTPETSSWSDVLVKTNIQDTLIVLEKSGNVEKFLNGTLSRNDFLSMTNSLIHENIEYQIDFRGIPKLVNSHQSDNRPIDIFCICDDSKWSTIETIIGDEIPFADTVINIGTDQSDEYLTSLGLRSEIDILIITEEVNMNVVRSFLENGQSVLLLKNLSASDVPQLTNVFGIEWDNSLSSTTFDFNDNIHGKNVKRYFNNLTTSTTFTYSNAGNNIKASEGFSIVGDTKSIMVGNIPTTDKGRTLWMPHYSGSNFENLLKSGILWLSTSKFVLNERDIPENIPSTTYTTLGVINNQQYEIRITTWRSFY